MPTVLACVGLHDSEVGTAFRLHASMGHSGTAQVARRVQREHRALPERVDEWNLLCRVANRFPNPLAVTKPNPLGFHTSFPRCAYIRNFLLGWRPSGGCQRLSVLRSRAVELRSVIPGSGRQRRNRLTQRYSLPVGAIVGLRLWRVGRRHGADL